MTNKTKIVTRREFQGEVVSGPKDKTIQALVKTIKTHAKYHKQYVSAKKYAVHDEKHEAKVGDLIVFQECRPYSKTKKWRLVKIIR